MFKSLVRVYSMFTRPGQTESSHDVYKTEISALNGELHCLHFQSTHNVHTSG